MAKKKYRKHKKGSSKKKLSTKAIIIRVLVSVFSGLLMLAVLGYLAVLLGVYGKLPAKDELSDIQHSQSTRIVDANEKTVGHLYRFYHSSVAYEDLPDHLVKALVSTEDARFYEHNGIDVRSLGRVFFKTLLMGDRSAGGGSTLSQQLAKNLYPREKFDKFSLLIAKVKESITATRLEKVYSKEEILALYLNTVSFSGNTFGVASAAKTFFNKPVKELTITEAATLVGMLKATYTYNPRMFPENSLARRNTVLMQMANFGDLPEDSAQILMEKPIELDYTPFNPHDGLAPYFREQVRRFLKNWADDHKKEDGSAYDIYGDGLQVHTTLDVRMQKAAEQAMAKHLKGLQLAFEKNWGNAAPWKQNRAIAENALARTPIYKQLKKDGLAASEILDSLSKPRKMTWFTWEGEKEVTASVLDSVKHHIKMLQAGFLAIEPQNGGIKAWVGGIDHKYFQFDHVNQSKRQVGSTFKPFVYTAALENGTEPCDYFSARTVKYANMEGWTPTNSEDEDFLHKNFTLQAALKRSLNTVSVKILEETGIPKVIEQARSLNIQSDLPEVPSLALGAGELTMLELAGAYASYVNDQKPVTPYFITKITDAEGKVLEEFKPIDHVPAYSTETKYMMLEMMQTVVEEGTGSRLRWKYKLPNDLAGKTGTTQSNRDGWFVGFNPELITVTWVGTDDGRIGFKDTSIGQGANSALPIFALFMQTLNRDASLRTITNAKFPDTPASIQKRMECPEIKEDGFVKKLFTNKDKTKEKDFDEDGKEKGFFKKMKGIFNNKD